MLSTNKSEKDVFAEAAALYKVEMESKKPCLEFLWTVAIVPLCEIKSRADLRTLNPKKDCIPVGMHKVNMIARTKRKPCVVVTSGVTRPLKLDTQDVLLVSRPEQYGSL